MSDELQRLKKLGWLSPPRANDGVHYPPNGTKQDISYPDEGLEVLGLEGGAGYWFDHRANAVTRALERFRVRTMWEIGSGTGAMAGRLTPPLRQIVTVEPFAQGAQAAAALGLTAFCSTLEDLHLPSNSLESVGAFDVIEHIEKVDRFLDEVFRVVQPGGFVIVTVPAFPSLWGDEDDFAGHKHRYTKTTLSTQFEQRGFKKVHTEYLYASLVPPAAITRALPYRAGKRQTQEKVLARMKSQLNIHPVLDRIARMVLGSETTLARHINLPFGLSILGAFRKI